MCCHYESNRAIKITQEMTVFTTLEISKYILYVSEVVWELFLQPNIYLYLYN